MKFRADSAYLVIRDEGGFHCPGVSVAVVLLPHGGTTPAPCEYRPALVIIFPFNLLLTAQILWNEHGAAIAGGDGQLRLEHDALILFPAVPGIVVEVQRDHTIPVAEPALHQIQGHLAVLLEPDLPGLA